MTVDWQPYEWPIGRHSFGLDVIRKVVLRQAAILNYVNPF
jgi:hypothetical protein